MSAPDLRALVGTPIGNELREYLRERMHMLVVGTMLADPGEKIADANRGAYTELSRLNDMFETGAGE